MTDLKEKIGQMFMVGLKGEALTQEERSAIRSYRFGGFILFSHNCREPAQLARLCRSVWETGTVHPPFIAIDQEGGRVHRLPPPFTHFPAAGSIRRRNHPDLAYKVGRATAAELTLVGINLNFAPVLDVDSNPNNPVIGDRSFGCEPEEVIRFAQPWMQGLRDGGIIPCAKHFPGHGDTDKDSHCDLPVVEKPLAELKRVELPPFVRACTDGIESLMTAHVLFRSLDGARPATLSQAIIGGLLRQELGYDGVVYSDDMEMKAISDNYGLEESALLAVRAGIDMLVYGHELARAVDAFELLYSEAERDPLLLSRVEQSHGRIAKLKQRVLKTFAASGDDKVEQRLRRLDHQKIMEQFHGSL